jgi:hypothetical protein
MTTHEDPWSIPRGLVPIVARVVWADDGEEYIDTEAAGRSGQLVYVRLPDRRYRLTSVWLNAADVRRC